MSLATRGVLNGKLRRGIPLFFAAFGHLFKGLAGCGKYSRLAGESFPPADRHVAIMAIDLDSARAPARPLGRDQDRA